MSKEAFSHKALWVEKLTLVPPALSLTEMHTILVCGYLASLDLRLGNLVFASLCAFLHEIAGGAVRDIRLGHQWRLLAQLLCQACHARLDSGVRLLDRLRPDICGETTRRMVETRRRGREASLRLAEVCFACRLRLSVGIRIDRKLCRTWSHEDDLANAFEQVLQV
jgi:hypothetical protein